MFWCVEGVGVGVGIGIGVGVGAEVGAGVGAEVDAGVGVGVGIFLWTSYQDVLVCSSRCRGRGTHACKHTHALLLHRPSQVRSKNGSFPDRLNRRNGS